MIRKLLLPHIRLENYHTITKSPHQKEKKRYNQLQLDDLVSSPIQKQVSIIVLVYNSLKNFSKIKLSIFNISMKLQQNTKLSFVCKEK